MSHYSVKPLEISLRPSRLLAVMLLVLHVMALLMLLVIPVFWSFRLIFGLVLIASFIYCLFRYALLRLPGSVKGLKLTERGVFRIRRVDGDWLQAEVLGESSVKPWLTVLSLKLQEQKLATHVLLLPDSLDQNEFRQLRIWLLWGHGPTEMDSRA